MKDLVIAVKNIETRMFAGAITRVEFKNTKDLGGKCGSFFTWSTNPKKALRFKNQLNATEVCVWLCACDNFVFNKEGYELVITTYDHLVATYESSKKFEQIRQEAIKRAENGDISSKTLKEIYGNDLIDKVEQGQKDGIYYATKDLITGKYHIYKVKIAKVWFGSGYLWISISDKIWADIHAEGYGKYWALTRKELEKVVR